MTYKTPGVYIQEISTFPPSVVPVDTAVPAFVGYTERAMNADGRNLDFVPTRIKSLLEFEALFGGYFRPNRYDIRLDTADENAISEISSMDAGGNPRRYYLYGCLRHFYANGGGTCYIVSVGRYGSAPALGNVTAPAGLLGGLSRLERQDEPTLLVFPDGVSLSVVELGALQAAALAQCSKLQDRFVIMDVRDGQAAPGLGSTPVATFRESVGTSHLKYGAAYYPWLRSIYKPQVPFRRLNLLDTAGVSIPESTLDGLVGEAAVDALVPAARVANANVAMVVTAVDIGGMTGPTPLTLSRDNFEALLQHFADLLDLLRRTQPSPVATVRQRFGNLMLLSRSVALSMQSLRAAPLPSELSETVNRLSEDSGLVDAIVSLVALEKNPDVMTSVSASRSVTNVETDYTALNGTPWITPHANVGAIAATSESFAGSNQRETALNASAGLQPLFERLAAAVLAIFDAAIFLADRVEKQLFEQHPVFRGVVDEVKRYMSLLPASGAVAGVYAATDRSRGVWKAPANVSIADVVGPAVKVNDADQSDLNVSAETGKSVNAIRTFSGKGTLIWGARTLAGNDNEWRYVPVRRFFNMAEESIKKATEPFVFEPNDANTWVRVRAMIENFLTGQWRLGALAGATTNQAFYVKVGLGETMTAEEILEGLMKVEIGLAAVRPAEFIVLKFSHKMQAS
jgi:phage tail sheath protein FI